MDRYNQFYSELCKALSSDSAIGTLGWMAAHGQSVVLNYGEDNQQWECSWITGDERYTAIRAEIPDAIKDVLGQVRTEYLTRFDFSLGQWRQ